jgi:hypothetical protein
MRSVGLAEKRRELWMSGQAHLAAHGLTPDDITPITRRVHRDRE